MYSNEIEAANTQLPAKAGQLPNIRGNSIKGE